MTNPWFKLFGVVVLTLVVGLASVRVYLWKQALDRRVFVAEQAAQYLFAPTGVLDAKGVPLRRVDLLDAVLTQVLKQK